LLIEEVLYKSEQRIIEALKAGKKVSCYGNAVSADHMNYDWQTPELRIRHAKGSSISAQYREIKCMQVEG